MRTSFAILAAAAMCAASAQSYRGEVFPGPGPPGVEITAASGDMVVGTHYNQYYGAAWLKSGRRYFAFEEGSAVLATDGRRAGGSDPQAHATIWSFEPFSSVDLHPPEYGEPWNSIVRDMEGEVQVGTIDAIFPMHGIVWWGSPKGYRILTPAGYSDSSARTIDGTDIYGTVSRLVDDGRRLLSYQCVWRNLGESVEIYGISGPYGAAPIPNSNAVLKSRNGVQVGFSTPPNNRQRPMLWRGWPRNGVDLSPPGLRRGEALATNGDIQVGWVRFEFAASPFSLSYFAAVWQGTPESFVNLHAQLPPGFTESIATAVTGDGTVYGYAWRTYPVPVVWRQVR